MNGSHTGARLAEHLKEVLDRFGLNDGRLLGITTDNASSNYSMTQQLQLSFEEAGMEWSAAKNHIPCMAHVIQLCLGAFMSSLGVKGREKSWEAHERSKHFDGNTSQSASKKDSKHPNFVNARIRSVAGMPPGLNKIIEKVAMHLHFEYFLPVANFQKAATSGSDCQHHAIASK